MCSMVCGGYRVYGIYGICVFVICSMYMYSVFKYMLCSWFVSICVFICGCACVWYVCGICMVYMCLHVVSVCVCMYVSSVCVVCKYV